MYITYKKVNCSLFSWLDCDPQAAAKQQPPISQLLF